MEDGVGRAVNSVSNRGAVLLILPLLLAGCAEHQERSVTDWLKVEVVRPATGTSGVIVLGASKEVYRVRTGSGWRVLGSGHPCRHMVLGEGEAVIIDLNDGKGEKIIHRGEDGLRPIREVFGRDAPSFVGPDRVFIDFYDCTVAAKPTGCGEVTIYRHDLMGRLLKTFHVALDERYPECQILASPRGFDAAGTPYLFSQCKMESERVKCLLLAPREDGLFIYAVSKDRPWDHCSDFPGLGVSLRGLELFEVLQ